MFESLRQWFGGGPKKAAALHPAAQPATDAEGKAWGALAGVQDPELGLDIVSMGLVRELRIEGSYADVEMTLTTRGCPVGPQMVQMVERALRGVGFDPEVKLVFDPPWTPDDMAPHARVALAQRRR